MMVSKFIEVEIKKGNLSKYKKYKSDIKVGEILKLPVSELSKGSNSIIEAKCHYCESVIEIKYKLFLKRVEKHDKFACCRKCAAIRTKEELLKKHGVNNISKVPEVKSRIEKTNLEKYGTKSYMSSPDSIKKRENTLLNKYGVDNPQKIDEVRRKTKETNIEKYGTEYGLSSKTIREKIKKTNLSKYGTEVASKSDRVKEKIKCTNLEKYGEVSPLLNNNIKNKSKETLEENWGVDYPLQSMDIMNKLKSTNIEKYGVEYPMQFEEIKLKSKETIKERYGVDHVSQYELYRKKYHEIANHKDYVEYLEDGYSLFKCGEGHKFKIHNYNYQSRILNNVPLCTICYPIGDQKSIKEKELVKYVESIYGSNIICGYRDGLEIDIYLPDLKLGFEFNGLYWHSDKFKKRSYHLDKLNHFKKKDIKIINIWEDDWDTKNSIIRSQIKNWMGATDGKIYARNCEFKNIKDVKESRNFLNDNHIQGFNGSSLKNGLYHNNELVSIMTFDKYEGRNKMMEGEWNLSRFCNKVGINIIGGFSKLLKNFIKINEPTRIISYADKSWSNGDVYIKNNFNLTNDSKPDYKYLINGKRLHKSRFKKSITGISESENDLLKVWDCGKLKFELLLN